MSCPVRLGEPLAELRRTDPPVQRLACLVAREDVQVEHDPASKRDTFPHAHRRCGRRYLFTVVCGKVSLMPLSNTSKGGTNPAHGCCWTRVKVLLASTISGVDALHTSIPISSHPTFHQVAVSGGCVPPNNSPRNLVVETSHFLDCENCLHCSTPCVVLILPKPQL